MGPKKQDLRPIKRSVTIRGHRTSVSLEQPFWDELQRMAEGEQVSLAAFIAEVDNNRVRDAIQVGLSCHLRIAVIKNLQDAIKMLKKSSQD
ncbi:MAG: ribbon-helix-helix domain-containing protein [Alphaproteobacteria bacterium]